MPLYEYECEAGHRFEIIRKFSDPPVEKCPKCGALVHKVQSAPAFHLKGTGWYITDYAKKDAPPAAKTETESKDAKDGAAKTEKTEKPEKSEKTATAEKSEKSEKTATKTEAGSTRPPKDKSA
jgi:putative FmdB family regulatory protein